MALRNHARGWHPLPVGRVCPNEERPKYKAPWFRGLTGYDARVITPEEIASWPDKVRRLQNERGASGILSLGLRCPTDRIGIDVDQYGKKHGLEQLRELEATYGPLPPAPVVTARPYDSGSGIRLFRVPDGYRGQTNPTDHIELIQWFHRYLVAPPSFHYTGNQYRRYRKDGQSVDSGTLPEGKAVPLLPEPWLAALADDSTRAGAVDASPQEIADFATRYQTGPQPQAVQWVLDSTVRAHADDTHNATRNALCFAAREAKGHRYGWTDAVELIRDESARSYRARGKRFDSGDFDRLVAYAVAEVRDVSEQTCYDRWQSDEHRAAEGDFDRSPWAASTSQKSHQDSDDDDPFNQGGSSDPDDVEVIQPLSGVKPSVVQWLWYGWIPLGKVSILEGESDVGKSTLTMAMASIVSQGKPWPTTVVGGRPRDSISDPASVVLVGIEDDNADTVVPRLVSAGADLNRVFSLNRPVDAKGQPKPFTIPDDIEWLRQAIVESEAKLVVIDPISACMPENTKHGVDSSIRRILMHIVDLARETDCAILLIRHFNKAQGMSAKNRGGGSTAYGALVRSVIQAGQLTKKADDGATHALARAIGNLSKEPASLGYSLDSATDNTEVAVVNWRGPIDLTADQLVGANNAKVGDARKNSPVRDAAVDAMRELLSGGPVPSNKVIDSVMLASGCKEGTVQKAAKVLGVVKVTHYKPNGGIDFWTWELPPQPLVKRG